MAVSLKREKLLEPGLGKTYPSPAVVVSGVDIAIVLRQC